MDPEIIVEMLTQMRHLLDRNMKSKPVFRVLDPHFGGYFHLGRNDHHVLASFIARRPGLVTGVVLDPALHERQRELRELCRSSGVDAVMDSKTVEMGTVGGFARPAVSGLPWANHQIDRAKFVDRDSLRLRAASIAKEVKSRGYSSVLAPAHYLESANDPWLSADSFCTRALRDALDETGLEDVPLYYLLCMSARAFRNPAQRVKIVTHLQSVPIDAVWLRLHPFGSSNCGPIVLRGVLAGCLDLQSLDLPLVADHSGYVGLSLMALGAVGGVDSGITYGENFNASNLLRKPDPDKKPFAPPPRVYLGPIGSFIEKRNAEQFFSKKGMKTQFACRDQHCCRRGYRDMIRNPREHYLMERTKEIDGLSKIPRPLVAARFLEEFIRPASDQALKAANTGIVSPSVSKRLEAIRITLSDIIDSGAVATAALVPRGKRVVRRLSA